MLERVLSIFAFLVLCAFMGIFIWKVQRIDLAVVIGITVFLAFWDVVSTLRRRRVRHGLPDQH